MSLVLNNWALVAFVILSFTSMISALTPENLSLEFPTRSDTNQPVQSQKQARRLKFLIQEEKLYFLCSENKGTDQLCSYCTADLRLCFHIGQKSILMMWLVFREDLLETFGYPLTGHWWTGTESQQDFLLKSFISFFHLTFFIRKVVLQVKQLYCMVMALKQNVLDH